MYKLYILDFDGTIADTNAIITRTMRATLQELGLPMRSQEECSATIGLPLTDCFKVLMPMDDDLARRCAEVYRRLFAQNNAPGMVPVFPGVLESIKRWHDAGAMVSIASSRGHESLDGFVRSLGLEEYIGYVLGLEDVERAKPDPFPVLKTLADLGVAARDAVVIGDMAYDIIMGRRAGCATVGVTYGNGSRQDLMDAGADWITDNLASVD